MRVEDRITLATIVVATVVLAICARAYGRNMTQEKQENIDRFIKVLAPISLIASLLAILIPLFAE